MNTLEHNVNSIGTTVDPHPTTWSEETVRSACDRMAPLWPLSRFVAVNPFWGLRDKPFNTAMDEMRRVSHSPLKMPASYYRNAWHSGEITDEDLMEASREAAKGAYTLNQLRDALLDCPREAKKESVKTLSEFTDLYSGRHASGHITEFLSKFLACYFDEDQSVWKAPYANKPLYAAWKSASEFDRYLDVHGIPGLKDLVKSLPADPLECIAKVLSELKIPMELAEIIMHRQLFSIGGWAAHCRRLVWEDEMKGKKNDTMIHLLAIRMACDLLLLEELESQGLTSTWNEYLHKLLQRHKVAIGAFDVWQEAEEIAFRRKMVSSLGKPETFHPPKWTWLQAVFCIDVRSEPFRRALEYVIPEAETIGFAGFFGFPIQLNAFGTDAKSAHCPVLINPALKAHECIDNHTGPEEHAVSVKRRMRKGISKAWRAFKSSAVGGFAFVETCGIGFGAKLLADGLGWSRPVIPSSHDGLTRSEHERIRPVLSESHHCGQDLHLQAMTAANALKNMGLTKKFARLVLICGHGSSTNNNPYGSALDCGACGGHAGGVNARIAAQTLNNPDVRIILADLGIRIPKDTLFLAGQQDTTTDRVKLYDLKDVPASHAEDIEVLQSALEMTAAKARIQRAEGLGLSASESSLHDEIRSRAKDWSQVRPEWGLAGNAAFIAAPRSRTAGLNLNGRAFLHSYEPSDDPNLEVLELIMCAPMVVANWINMQYFASTMDNERFGSGNKVIHNCLGSLGVLQGNGGDLKTGLPWQSVHDGKQYVHRPVRLQVFIESKPESIDSVIAKHEVVRNLVENQWVRLHCIDHESGRIVRKMADGGWRDEKQIGKCRQRD